MNQLFGLQHRRVSGLVRANVKEEVRKQIESELNEEG